MKCGDTNIELNTRVKISGIKGEDEDLNGLTGRTTHPFAFGCNKRGWIGIWLDKQSGNFRGDNCNVHISEIEVL